MQSKLLFSLLCCCFAATLSAQNALNITRLAHWDDDTLPIASPGSLNLQYSGCWGLAVNGHEIAILGGARHVLFFDVTNPAQTKLIGKFAGNKNTIWREFKSYKNRVYAVSDNTDEGLMVFDMSKAPETIVRTYYSNEYFNSSHTIALDTVSGRIYLNGCNASSQGMTVLSVKNNPDKPELLSHIPMLQCGYIHDSYVRGDTVYASSGNNGYCIYDFTDYDNPKFIAAENTGGYNHNSWLTLDGRYAYYTEEIPQGRPVQIVDLQNLTVSGEVKVVGSFLDNLLEPTAVDKKAIPHNVYISGNLLFNSQYEDGLLVYDISNPTQPVLKAFYDTHPQNTQYNTYYGNWGNYPWLPSGNIVVGDMQNGLMILKLGKSVGTATPTNELPVHLSPNPASDALFVEIPNNQTATDLDYRLLSPTGQVLASGTNQRQSRLEIPLTGVPAGLYFLHLSSENGQTAVRRVMVAK